MKLRIFLVLPPTAAACLPLPFVQVAPRTIVREIGGVGEDCKHRGVVAVRKSPCPIQLNVSCIFTCRLALCLQQEAKSWGSKDVRCGTCPFASSPLLMSMPSPPDSLLMSIGASLPRAVSYYPCFPDATDLSTWRLNCRSKGSDLSDAI